MNSKANRLVTDLLGEAFEADPYVGWMRAHLSRMKDGGVWITSYGHVFEADHKHKTLTLVEGPVDTLFHRTQAVCMKLGYRVVRKESKGPDDHITVTECGPTN